MLSDSEVLGTGGGTVPLGAKRRWVRRAGRKGAL